MKVFPNWLRQNYKGAIIIENHGAGFSLLKLSHAEFEIEKAHDGFFQALPTRSISEEAVISFERLIAKLELLHNNGDLKDQLIVVGRKSDPFLPILEKLESSIALLDALCHYRGQHCVIQTRSPHVILAVPLLRNNAAYFSVCMGMETLSDLTAHTLTPSLASPTDRCVAVRTLTSLGLHCEVTLFPISTRPQTAADTQQCLNLLSQISNGVHLVEIEETEDRLPTLYDWHLAMLFKQQLNEKFLLKKFAEESKQAA